MTSWYLWQSCAVVPKFENSAEKLNKNGRTRPNILALDAKRFYQWRRASEILGASLFGHNVTADCLQGLVTASGGISK